MINTEEEKILLQNLAYINCYLKIKYDKKSGWKNENYY